MRWTKERYREYLRGELYPGRWAGIRKAVWRRDKGICQRCGVCQGRRDCHHVRYSRLLTDFEIMDVILVCQYCHEREHGLRPPLADSELLESFLFSEPPEEEECSICASQRRLEYDPQEAEDLAWFDSLNLEACRPT